MSGEQRTFGLFSLDMARGRLLRNGRPVAVSHKGLLLLQALLENPGEAIEKSDLMQAAWPDTAVEESNLSVQIAALRKLLGTAQDGNAWITTVPRVGYRFVGPVDGGRKREIVVEEPASTARASVAVLPFSNIGDPDQGYLADGLTEDVITALSRFRWFRVVTRGTSFAFKGTFDIREAASALSADYLLQGSVRRAAQQLRISTRLVEARSGDCLWTGRYDLEMADVFAIQDEIAERVVGAIEPELLKTESHLAATRHTGNMTAWDLVRQGMWYFHKITREGHLKARELFREGCTSDGDLPESHIWLARVSAGIIAYGWSVAPASDGKEGTDAAIRAIMLDPRDPYARYALAIISAYAGSSDVAIDAAERAIDLSPSFALGHLVLGLAKLFAGHAAEAVAPLEYGLTLNPNDPQNAAWYNLLAYAELLAGEPRRALDSANKALAVRPVLRPTFETLAYCYVALGQLDDARRWASRMRELDGPASHFIAPLRRKHAEWDDRLAGLLRQAST